MEFESLMPNVANTTDAGRQPPENNEEAVRIGRRLRALRSERGMTILELAAKAGVSSGNVSQIERGASNPSINTLHKLRAALGVNLWAFLEDDKRQSVGESPYIAPATKAATCFQARSS
jgi:transcriptional regulator with XRE-family HTH domain